jgi:hypothetical protein
MRFLVPFALFALTLGPLSPVLAEIGPQGVPDIGLKQWEIHTCPGVGDCEIDVEASVPSSGSDCGVSMHAPDGRLVHVVQYVWRAGLPLAWKLQDDAGGRLRFRGRGIDIKDARTYGEAADEFSDGPVPDPNKERRRVARRNHPRPYFYDVLLQFKDPQGHWRNCDRHGPMIINRD